MEFCPAGILCVAIGIYITLKRKDFIFNMVLYAAVLQIFFEKGFIIKSGDTVLALEYFPFLILTAYSIVHVKLDMSKQSLNLILLLGCYCMSLILLLIFPSNAWAATGNVQWDDIIFKGVAPLHPTVNMRGIQTTIKFAFCPLIYLLIYKHWTFKDYKKFISHLSNISNYFLMLGTLEFIIKNLLHLNDSWGDLMHTIFGDTIFTVYAGRLRGFFYESNLFTREASHYAYSLFCVSIIKYADNIINDRVKKIDHWILLCIVLMLLSTSFASVNMIIAFICISLVYRWGVLRPNTMTIEMTMTGILLFITSVSSFALSFDENNFIGRRLDNLLSNFGYYVDFNPFLDYVDARGDGSTFIRILSIIQTFRLFLERPLFGYSLGTLISHGSFSTFLSNVGIVGVICWLNYYMLHTPLYKTIRPCILPYYIGTFVYLNLNFWGGSSGMAAFYLTMPLVFNVCFCFIYQFHENHNRHNML